MLQTYLSDSSIYYSKFIQLLVHLNILCSRHISPYWFAHLFNGWIN